MPARSAMPLLDVDEFTQALANSDVDLANVVVDDKGTIGSRSKGTSTTGGRLSVITSAESPEIVVVGSLSKGGMGEVLLARQNSLGRDVAVKRLRSGGRERDSDLIIEGRIAGQLEHPNIVPIHVLGADEDGRPLLVMKRVEGESWRDMLKAGRDLERDLEIIMSVCQALHFAHSKGVAHCDVKPANVMVGRFGEVYLVDWGIAVGFGECAIADVPMASSIKGVFGTPKYMAPEMALPSTGVDHRTDVYSVGAVLFEIVTGKPLRQTRKVEDLLMLAHTAAPPVFGPGVDEELAAICTRALARNPDDRFAGIDDLREALATWTRHGAARVLTVSAERALTTLRAGVDEAVRPGSTAVVDDASLRRLFVECRFGFQAALGTWPESLRARGGLDEAMILAARLEVARGELVAARALVAALEVPPADLVASLAALEAAQHDQAAAVLALQRFAVEHDPRTAERERAVFVFVAGLAWLAMTLTLDQLSLRGIYAAGAGTFALFTGVFAAVFAVGGVVVPQLRQTAASRALIITMFCGEAGLCAAYSVGWKFDVDAAVMLAIGQTMLTVTGGSIAATDQRLWPAVMLSGASVPLHLLWPERAIALNGIVCFLVLTDIARRWRAPPTTPPTPVKSSPGR